ncbi:hypothetical protein GGS26DRAFT_542654 [Hypomontagnella submonticulosa]|nr:hypothetical protein GGS26DRAFT_542654 [Hypomontagnella submonticulosa]
MPHPIQRSACDRCHGQKLKCTRASSGGACVRCAKARAVCTWSPSLRCRRTSRSEAQSTIDTRGGATNVLEGLGSINDAGSNSSPCLTTAQVDTPYQFTQSDSEFNVSRDAFQADLTLRTPSTFVNSASGSSPSFAISTDLSSADLQFQDGVNTWQERFNQEWAMLSVEQQPFSEHSGLEGQTAPSEEQAQEPSGSHLVAVRELSDLIVELFALSSAVPKPPASTLQPLSWKNKDFAIDKTFQLSQKLIEVLDKAYLCYPRNSMGDSSLRGSETGQPGSFDQASFLLVLSCYQRLIEIYDNIFGNMQACLDRAAITAPEDYVRMPDMKVGSFSLPNSSALQITLVLQLARHLIQRMGLIIKGLGQSRTQIGDNMSDLMSPTLKAVNDRETTLIERIHKLRSTLVSLDML